MKNKIGTSFENLTDEQISLLVLNKPIAGGDNVQLNAITSSGQVIATDLISTVHHQRVKVQYGADGSATDVAPGNPLPVDLSDSSTRDCGKIDIASFDVSLPTGTNTLGTVNVSGLFIPPSSTLIGRVQLRDDTDSNFLGSSSSPVAVSGAVVVHGLSTVGGSLAVSGAMVAHQGDSVTHSGGWLVRVSDGTSQINVGDATNQAVRVNVVSGSAEAFTDNSVFSPNSDAGVPWFAFVDETAPASVSEGQVGVVRMAPNRNMYVNIRDSSGSERGLGIDSQNNAQVTLRDSGGSSAMDEGNSAVRVNVVAGGGTGGTSGNDDSAFTAGTTSINPVGGFYNDSSPDSVDEGDMGIIRMSANRNMFTTIRDAAGNERGVNVTSNNELQVLPTARPGVNMGAVTISGTPAITVSTSLPSGDNNIGNFDIASAIPAGSNVIGGVTVSGSYIFGGGVPHDSIDQGNPLKIGGLSSTNEPTAVTAGDRVNAWFDTWGRMVTLGGHANPEAPVSVSGSATGITVVGAPGAGVSLYICEGVVNASGGETLIKLRESGVSLPRWQINAAAGGGGSRFNFGDRGWQLTANTGLEADIINTSATAWINVEKYYIA